MPNDSDSALFPWILSALIVVISTVAVILGSADGAQSAPMESSAKPVAVQSAAGRPAAAPSVPAT